MNLELTELIAPKFSFVSSVGVGGKYNFPHQVSFEAIREGIAGYDLGKHSRRTGRSGFTTRPPSTRGTGPSARSLVSYPQRGGSVVSGGSASFGNKTSISRTVVGSLRLDKTER